MGISRTKYGKFQATPVVGGRKFPSRTFDTRTMAEVWHDGERARIVRGLADAGLTVPATRGAPTFRVQAARFLQGYVREATTRTVMRRTLGTLNETFGDMPVTAIGRREVKNFVREMAIRGRPKAGGQRWQLNALRQVLESAVDDEHLKHNPAAGVKVEGKDVPRPQRIVSDEEFSVITEHLDPWLVPAAVLAREAGLRAGEVLGLRGFRLTLTPDVHGNGWVEVADVLTTEGYREYPKGKVVLSVPLTTVAVNALSTHRAVYGWSDDDRVFVNQRTGQPTTYSAFNNSWVAARERAGITRRPPHFHDLRHSFATKLARDGWSAPDIRDMCRHADLRTSQGYVDALDRDGLSERLSRR